MRRVSETDGASLAEVAGGVTFERFGGSWAFWAHPRGFRPHQPIRFCLGCHGHGGWVTAGEADWLRQESGGRPTLVRLVERGLLVGMSHAAGDAWGNEQAQADCVAFLRGLRDRFNLGPRILLFGRSMGGPLAVNLTLGRLRGQVERLVLLQPVVDLVGRIERNPHDSLLVAFGLDSERVGGVDGRISETLWAERVSPHCPLTQMRALAGRGPAAPPLPPLSVWLNRSDQTCRLAFTEAFVALWRQAGGRADLHVLDGEGHTVYGQEPVATEVADFLCAR